MKAQSLSDPETAKDMQKLAGIISKPKFDPYVKLVADALLPAAIGDPLQQIRIMVFQGYAFNAIHDEKIDEAELEVLDCVARALLSPVRTAYHSSDLISVPWSFKDTKENYEKYVKAWDTPYLEHYPGLAEKPEPGAERWAVFFGASACLTEVGYQSLVSAFTHWSAPKVAAIWARIAQGVVTRKTLADPSKVTVTTE